MISDELSRLCQSVRQVGSRVTCNPPPTDTDDDWLCLAHDLQEFVAAAALEGFHPGGSGFTDEPMSFVSLKRDADDLNLIATTCATFYDGFILATGLAKRFNLMYKADRIALFQAVLYGNAAEDV